MLRETVFAIGGAFLIAFGAALAVAMVFAGIGWNGLDLYLSTAAGIGFGAFFIYVGRIERSARRRLADPEPPAAPP